MTESNSWKKRVAGIGTLIVGVGFLLGSGVASAAPPSADEAKPAETAAAFAITTAVHPDHAGGDAGAIVVTIKANGGHKFNKDYPTKLTFAPTPAGLKLSKDTLTKADGKLADAHTFAFTSKYASKTPGEYEVTGTVKFSVCNDQVCLLKKEPVIAKVTVK